MYTYQEMRPELFTERGTEMLLQIRTNVQRMLAKSGAVRAQEATQDVTGLNWLHMAALDYLVEKEEIREVTDGTGPGQHRVFIAGRRAA